MKKTLIIFCINFFVVACGKNEVDIATLENRNNIYYEINQDKPFSGKIKEYYKNGQLKTEGIMKDGAFNNIKKSYYRSGQIDTIVKYHDKKMSSFEKYYENGQLHVKLDIY